jgi:hypothetical protein
MDRRHDWDEDVGLDAIEFDEDRDLVPFDDAANPANELVDALKSVERHRDQLQAAASYVQAILASDPDLHRQWNEFTHAGGITADDFRQFLDGRFRYRLARQRKHLRLVVKRSLSQIAPCRV